MILAIESSCDESAVALFDKEAGLTAEYVHTQIELHKVYGGVVPDLASREHLKNFPVLLDTIIKAIGEGKPDMIAVTHGPGLAGCLALGISLAKALGLYWGVPVCGVNHLRGHAWSVFIDEHKAAPREFEKRLSELLPHLGLIVSGGNTLLFEIDEQRAIHILAQSVDDAAGEAFDKGAKLLGFPYPGGPLIEKNAVNGNESAYDFPRAFPGKNEPKFSFSGLKTSLRYTMQTMDDATLAKELPHLCASYQKAIIDALIRKAGQFLQAGDYRSMGLSGGVANNKALRAAFQKLGEKRRLPCFIAQPRHTGDNAGMIAFAAYMEEAQLRASGGQLTLLPSLPLTSLGVSKGGM